MGLFPSGVLARHATGIPLPATLFTTPVTFNTALVTAPTTLDFLFGSVGIVVGGFLGHGGGACRRCRRGRFAAALIDTGANSANVLAQTVMEALAISPPLFSVD